MKEEELKLGDLKDKGRDPEGPYERPTILTTREKGKGMCPLPQFP